MRILVGDIDDESSRPLSDPQWCQLQCRDVSFRRARPSHIDALAAVAIEVPREGLEPSRACAHRILSPARLPIPPPRLSSLKTVACD